jgi:rare lipoprotein A
MDLNVLSTQNWSRAFNVWIEDIQVVCHPVVTAPFEIQHSLLRKARSLSRYTAVVVMLLFSLHCTRPQVVAAAAPPPEVLPEETAAPVAPHVYTESGYASWYGGDDGFEGRSTASGEAFNPGQFTCAHRTLPFGTSLEVKNLGTGKRTIVTVNDRGPFVRGRMLDVSEKAAKALGMHGAGTARVRIRTVDAHGRPAPLEPAPAAEERFTIQVAALTNPVTIAPLSQELQSALGPVNLSEAHTLGGVTVKRVRVGTFAKVEDAQKAAEDLARLFKDRGLEPFITRED